MSPTSELKEGPNLRESQVKVIVVMFLKVFDEGIPVNLDWQHKVQIYNF